MKTKLLALALIAASSMFAETRFSISIGTGGYNDGYYAQAPYGVVRPPCPGPDYSWVDGYYRGDHAWVPGYWSKPAYNAYQNQERYENRSYDGYGRADSQPYVQYRNEYRANRSGRDRDNDNRDRGREWNARNR